MRKRILLISDNEYVEENLCTQKSIFKNQKNEPSPVASDRRWYTKGKFGSYDIVFFKLKEQEPPDRAATILDITNAIDSSNPCAVILSGIAIGTPGDKQKIGDILLSKCIAIKHTAARQVDDVKQIETNDLPCGRHLLSIFQNYLREWESANKRYHVKDGVILSGREFIDEPEIREEIFKKRAEMIGCERNGDCVYAACSDKGIAEWIIIKGVYVAGTGDVGKIEEQNKEQKSIAANNAISFLHFVFSRKNSFSKLTGAKGGIIAALEKSNAVISVAKSIYDNIVFIGVGLVMIAVFAIQKYPDYIPFQRKEAVLPISTANKKEHIKPILELNNAPPVAITAYDEVYYRRELGSLAKKLCNRRPLFYVLRDAEQHITPARTLANAAFKYPSLIYDVKSIAFAECYGLISSNRSLETNNELAMLAVSLANKMHALTLTHNLGVEKQARLNTELGRLVTRMSAITRQKRDITRRE